MIFISFFLLKLYIKVWQCDNFIITSSWLQFIKRFLDKIRFYWNFIRLSISISCYHTIFLKSISVFCSKWVMILKYFLVYSWSFHSHEINSYVDVNAQQLWLHVSYYVDACKLLWTNFRLENQINVDSKLSIRVLR